MKWLGLTLIVLGWFLLSDHDRSAPAAIGWGIVALVLWWSFERQPVHVSPDASDWTWEAPSSAQLEESSTGFDLTDLEPFLRRLLGDVSGGFTEKTVAHIVQLAHAMQLDEERSLGYEVVFRRQRLPLKIGLFKDDLNEVTVYFYTAKPLAKRIDAEMEAFFAERGM